MYATDRKKSFRKVQLGLNVIEEWYERWNIKNNENKTGDLLRHREAHIILNGRNNPFVNHE
jgi:hypothetical protein